MFRTLSNVFIDIFTGHSSSFLSSLQFVTYIGTGIKWIFGKIFNFIFSIIWTVIKLILGLIDAFSYIINSLLGIDTTLDDYTNIAKSIGGSGSRNYLDTLVDVFRALIGVSIILLLVFTIIAVIRQEIDFAKSGFVTDSKKGKGNNKMGILKNLFRNLMAIIVLPLAMICVIVGVNSILSAFNKALQGDNQNVSLAGQVLYASTYDANKYRRYANSNQRIPIIIKAYDSDKYSVYETDQLALEIRKVDVQNKLKEVATNTANKSFLSFEKSLTYKNNKFYNSTDFGDYFEQFICTPEQYYVMADFIDYVQKYSLNYYIKSIDDPNVEWKYVEDVVYKSSSNELNITYRDNSDLNSNGSSSDYYTLSLAPKNEVTSPISDAMDSIMAMLGVGSYGDNVYNTMERDDSGNYVNLVQWANEKCYLHFSSGFDRNTPLTWTDVDEILMYEYNRYSSNNTLSAFTFDQLTADESDPNYTLATLDVMQIKYSTYNEEADVYLEKEPLNCVLINGNYYYVKKSETKTDKFGNALYEIVSQNELSNNVVRYLDPSYSLLKKTGTPAYLKFSAGFNINDRTTWKTIDQVLLYEYYKNISIVMNDLGTYTISKIKDEGVKLDIYEITEYVANVNERNEFLSYSETTNNYVMINGTYYQLNASGTIGNLSEKYLLNSETEVKTHYNYYLQITDNYINGFDSLTKKDAKSFIYGGDISHFSDTDASDDIFYVNFSLQLSEGFDYKDTSTWSYRDYFIFYLYVNYAVSDSFDALKYTGIEGTVKKNGSKYYFFPKQSSYVNTENPSNKDMYFDIDDIKTISELNINKTLDINEVKENNYIDTNDNDLFISYSSISSTFLKENAETKLITFSDDYDYYDVSTWTMSDLILNYFSSKSVINSASVLENSGYGALKLEVRDGDKNLVDTVYTFGSYLGTTYYCLSEKNLKNYKNVNGQKMNINSVEEFLNMNAFSFICSYNGLVKNNIVTTYDNISASLFQNYENFVLDYDGLIDELVSDNFSEILTKAVKYTYTNESLDANDPSTWTMFDLICYTITGTAKKSISGNVIVKDGKNYFVIKDKAIPISEGVCKGTLSDGDNTLTAKKITYGTTYTQLETYYNSTILPLLKNNYEIAGLTSLDTFKVQYNPNKTINKSSYAHSSDITILDAIILMTSESGKVENRNYFFNVYTDGDHEYLNVNGKYIQLTREISGIDGWIKYNPSHTFTLTDTSKVFTNDGSYTSFNSYTTRAGDTYLSTFSNLDCLIYAITDSVESSVYSVYKKTSSTSHYIFISGQFIDCTTASIKNEQAIKPTRTDGKDSDESRAEDIDYLYETYYSQYVANSASFDSDFARQLTNYKITFNKNERLSWTPINIILYKNGFLTGDGVEATFEGEYTISLNGDRTYFIYSKTDIIAGTKSIVIDVTDIGYIDNPIAGELDSRKYLRNKDSAIYEMNLRLFCVLDNNLNFLKDGEGNILTSDEVLSRNYKFNELTYLSGTSEVKDKNDLKVTFANANNFNLSTVTTWTWYDLLYYNLFGDKFAGASYFVYYSGTERYAEITDGNETYYVLSNDGTVNLTQNFSDDGTVNVSYNASDANSATLGFVAYKITNKTESLLNKYKFTSHNTNKTFFYVKNVFTGKFNGIYKLTNSSTEIKSSKTVDSYTYVVSNSDNVSNWSLFDFVIYYASSYTGDRSYHSQLETFGVSQYFVIGETYINLTALSSVYNGDNLIVKKNADKTLSATRSLQTTCGFGDSEAVSGTTKQDCIFVINYDKEEVVTKFKQDSNKITNLTTGYYAQLFKFSDNFNPSDYTTWTLADMMIYYAFKNGFYGTNETFDIDYLEYYLEDNTVKSKVVSKTLSTKNFQDFINIGGAPGYVYYAMTTDSFGNSSVRKVINFGNSKINGKEIYYDYEVFMRLASRVTSYVITNDNQKDKISVKMTEMRTATEISATDIPHFIYSEVSENAKVDFAYKNYYYFNYDTSKFYETYADIDTKISSSVIYQILNYGKSDALIKGTLNIRLSDGFDINDISTWTMLDYIVVYEYSREFEGNEFAEISFSDMMTVDNYFVLYGFDSEDNLLVLNINDSYYNVANYVEKVNPDSETSMEYKLKTGGITSPASAGVVTSDGASADKYGFRTLYEKINFTRNMTISGLMYDFGENSDSFNYEFEDGKRIYRKIYQNTCALYKADFSDPKFSKYSISPYIKQVSWPEKIMTDMQVLYPDLNWSTLIATDGWLDTLGEFTSAYANGQFVSKNNSSNTTAAGLVLSEFFLSVSKEVSDGFGYFEYETLFDENVIKSLMLSLLGEESYTNLSKQAEIFVEMFNTSFAPILDEIARENEIEILDGQVNNFTMCVYKSYLATVLLSSDIGEYLYTIATRVYAQYTIYESLATAAGDYSGYYAYTSGQKDENGDEIDYFTYSSFYELVKYENMLSGQSSPVYTFNMKKAYESYAKEYGSSPATITLNNSNFLDYYRMLYNYINEKYRDAYSSGGRISDKSDIYCFMFDAYYSMLYANESNVKNTPTYLKLYKEYLDGSISRWGMVKDASISDTSKYISKYDTYKKARTISKFSAYSGLLKLMADRDYYQDEDSSEEENKNFFQKLWDDIKSKVNELINSETSFGILYKSFGSSYRQKLMNLMSIMNESLFDYSDDGSNEAWQKLIDINEDLDLLITEVTEIRDLDSVEGQSQGKTENGSRKMYVDDYYVDALDDLNKIKLGVGNYISAQKMMDKIVKSSITFTLGQYGQNYVTDGFDFNIENKRYTFDSNLSATRLAEYVYGGAYLKGFNINPIYTDEEYNGLVSVSKVYDKKEGYLKTSLEMWPELRRFASELANYTSKLYYQTNLKNTASNVSDGVLLTDYIKAQIQTSSGNRDLDSTTSEFLILYYLIKESDISADTLVRLIFADTTTTLSHMTCSDGMLNYTKIKEMAGVLDGTRNDLSLDDLTNKQAILVDYLCFVYSTDYNSFGYYNSGSDTPSERIHKVFKNVVSYLLVAEDSETSESEDALKLDNLTFKDFKLLLMDKIVDYQQNPSETAKENSARYITIFNLISAQFNYADSTNVYIGTSLRAVDLTKDSATVGNSTPVIKYKPLSGSYVRASFVVDKSTRNNILNLAGLANRPIEELVNLEYDKLYDRNGMYDEASGDIFVVCSYNQTTGKYIPYLACSNDYSIVAGSKFEEYKQDYFSERSLLRTDYYDDSQAYPIIAKGIINSSGEPTAIKIVDNKVVFYRTTVLASASLSDDAISATMSVSEVNTVGYIETVESTSYKKLGLFSGRTTMFIGSSDIKTYLSSKANVFFLQNEIMYDLPKDDFDGISVLDEFSSHYNLDFQTYFLLIMSFATLVPFLFNATAAVLRRVLDLIFLILIGPVMISMKSFDYNDNGKGFGAKAFDSWKNMVSQALLSAFGYIIGFNVYYILVSSVLTMSFVSPATMTNINRIGGLSLLSVATVNTILRFLYVLTAVSIIKAVANMLTNIVTSGKVSNAFVSPVGGDEPMQSVKAVVGEVKSMAEKTAGVVNGQALLDLKNAAFEQAKNMVPGSAIITSAADNVKGGVDYFKSRAMQKSMQAAGVDKKVAKQAAKQFRETNKQQREIKQKNRVASANRFMSTYTHYISEEDKKKKKNVEPAFDTNIHIMPGIVSQLKPPKKEKKDKGKKDKAKKGKKKK